MSKRGQSRLTTSNIRKCAEIGGHIGAALLRLSEVITDTVQDIEDEAPPGTSYARKNYRASRIIEERHERPKRKLSSNQDSALARALMRPGSDDDDDDDDDDFFERINGKRRNG